MAKGMIPIFIITCDRLEMLKQSIQSYHDCIKTPFEIVIVDFGSTYEPTVEFLKQLESTGSNVYWQNKIIDSFDIAGNCIADYFESHLESEYVVTDPDIVLDNTRGNILEVYSFLLKLFPKISVVGPMLRIDDIPDHYPLKGALISGKRGLHKGFHSQRVYNVACEHSPIQYITAPIDTTFGMYRAGSRWSRLQKGIRVLPPYGARHLDWYIDPGNLTPDQEYYMQHSSDKIAHWSKW